MRVLVIDDDVHIRQYLRETLESDGFTVDTAGDGSEGSYMARTSDYDAIILDYILPKKNGHAVLNEIRSNGKTTPVLVLSVENEIDDKVNLLEVGADDYLTKPFSYRELLSRIRALTRRPNIIVSPLLTADDFTIDTNSHRAFRGEREIYLTRKEFGLIEYLMRNSGKVVTRGMLMEHVWGDNVDAFSNTIEVHIRNLRKKIDEGSEHKIVQTVPGRGYKINAHRMIFR